MATKIEFYRSLREHIPDEAARLIADEMPTESQLATKDDVVLLRNDLARFREDLASRFTQVDERIHGVELSIDERIHGVELSVERMRSSFFRWNLAFFVPLWVGVYATLLAILVRGIHL